MRDYDPTTGRYIQADPLGLVDGASVYGYALQNPGRYVDPRGLSIAPETNPSSSNDNQANQICEFEDDWCDKQYDYDVKACYDKHRKAIISNLGMCIQRAGEILAACKAGDPEPAPWNEQDEDVPLPGERGPFEFKIPPVVPFFNPKPPGSTYPPKIHNLPQMVNL